MSFQNLFLLLDRNHNACNLSGLKDGPTGVFKFHFMAVFKNKISSFLVINSTRLYQTRFGVESSRLS